MSPRGLLLNSVRFEVLGEEVTQAGMHSRYAGYFPQFVRQGIEAGLLDERLSRFDLSSLGAALDANRDFKFGYLGLQTLYDRYFLHVSDRRIELPQAFFMRVAMGLAINEVEREARAIEFYNVLSSFDFMSSTPTLFQFRDPTLATIELLPDPRSRTIWKASTMQSRERAAVEVCRRAGQRLDAGACARISYQGNER